jgi:hypothetical protein
MARIEFHHTESEGSGRFTAMADDVLAGVMTYSRIGKKLIRVDHTEVYAGFDGKGLGTKLVAYGVKWARKHGQKISPRCSFTRHVFERTPEHADVWRQ